MVDWDGLNVARGMRMFKGGCGVGRDAFRGDLANLFCGRGLDGGR